MKHIAAFAVCAATLSCTELIALAAPQSDLVDRHWLVHDESSTQRVDQAAFATFLERYTVERDGVVLVNYQQAKNDGYPTLKRYLRQLESTKVSGLSRSEQFAYWANLYNALTLSVVLEAYPVESIKDIGSTLSGPWKTPRVEIEGRKLSLDDIEHGILRPIFRDPRVHFAVNCASLGCPNLPRPPLTGSTLEERLDSLARSFLSHPRGLERTSNGVLLSELFRWYRGDFGRSDAAVLKRLAPFAPGALRSHLAKNERIVGYHYDWGLNEFTGTRP